MERSKLSGNQGNGEARSSRWRNQPHQGSSVDQHSPGGEIVYVANVIGPLTLAQISSNASCSLEEMCAVRSPSQPLFFQLYVNRNRSVATELIQKVNHLKMDAIFLTGDAPVGGKRERDLRLKGEFEGPAGGVSEKSDSTQGVSQAMFAGVDPDLCWDDIA